MNEFTLIFSMPSEPQVLFISYAWGGESESVADEIDQAVMSAGIMMIRDKRDLGFKGLIKEFMETIGQGHAVILVISDKYLKSANCMFELLEVQKNGDFYNRVFPLVLPDAAIYKSTGIISYLKYWEDQIDELNEAIKGLDSFADTQGIRDDIDLFTDIRGAIATLAATFRNMNTLTVAEMRSKSFAPLLDVLGKRVSTNKSIDSKPKSKYGKVLYHIPELMQIQEWTRCIVRLAWDELLLTENLKTPEEGKVIDDIRLGEVMQVCLEEGRYDATFEIKSLSSKEQIILLDDYTEWLFDVKALKEGSFTLVLRVTLLQIVEGFGERKKDIVLERNVTTKTLAPESLPVFEAADVSLSKPAIMEGLEDLVDQGIAEEMVEREYSQAESHISNPTVFTAPSWSDAPQNPKNRITFRRIMPYAASLMLLCIASVVMWPEIKGTFEEDNPSMEINDSDGLQENPNTSVPEYSHSPDPEMTPPVISPNPYEQSYNEQKERYPISAGQEVQLPVSRLVLIGIKTEALTDGIALEENDYLFLVDYYALDTLQLERSKLTFYNIEDTTKLANFKIKEVDVKQIQDSMSTGGSQKKWKLKHSLLKANPIAN
jgi:hypothetical protein